MKPFLLAAAVTAVLITLCASFSSGNASGAPNATAAPGSTAATALNATAATARQNAHYYWFLTNGDTYDGFNTLSVEVGRMETLLGVYCDNNPVGGTLVASGYTLPIVPHIFWASAFVFSH